jgi:hypothetical protein
MLDVMRRRAPLAALLIGVAVAGFLAIGLVQAAGSGPDLGGPVVVSQTSKGSAQPREGRTPQPTFPERTTEPTSPKRTASEPAATEPTATERPAVAPSKRSVKVEPVRPASPRPGGDDGDDGDDGGHGDEGGHGDDGDDDD